MPRQFCVHRPPARMPVLKDRINAAHVAYRQQRRTAATPLPWRSMRTPARLLIGVRIVTRLRPLPASPLLNYRRASPSTCRRPSPVRQRRGALLQRAHPPMCRDDTNIMPSYSPLIDQGSRRDPLFGNKQKPNGPHTLLLVHAIDPTP